MITAHVSLTIFVDEAALFAQLIARTAKDIDVLIDSLPSEDSSPELQVSLLYIQGSHGSCKVLKSPEFRVFQIQDLKSPEIGQWS